MLNPHFLYRNILNSVKQHVKENMDVKTAQSLFITRMIWYDIWISTMGPSPTPVIHVGKHFCAVIICDFTSSNIREWSPSSVTCAKGVFTTDPTYVNIWEPIRVKNRPCVRTVRTDALNCPTWENIWPFTRKKKHFSVIHVVCNLRIFFFIALSRFLIEI
jgi:hypothetical protein